MEITEAIIGSKLKKSVKRKIQLFWNSVMYVRKKSM